MWFKFFKRRYSRGKITAPHNSRTEGSAESERNIFSWILLLLIVMAAIAITQWRGAPHPIFVGHPTDRSIVARTDFSFEDLKGTESQKEIVKIRTSNMYVEELVNLHVMERQVKHLFDKSSQEVGLRKWKSSTTLANGRAYDEVLRECIRAADVDVYENSVKRLFQLFKKRGVVSAERYEQERRSQKVKVIRSGGGKALIRVDTLLAPGYSSELRTCIQETFTQFPDLCQKLLKELFVDELVPTLNYDPETSENLKKEAVKKVATVIKNFKEGAVLLPAGARATSEDIKLLRAESRKYYSSQKPWDLASRIAGISCLTLLVSALIAYNIQQFHQRAFRSRMESFKLGFLCLIALGVAKGIILLGPQIPFGGYLIPAYLIPLPFFSAVITIVYSSRLARVLTYFLAILIGIMAGNNFSVMVVLVFASLVSTNLSTTIRERSKPMIIGLYSGLIQLLTSVALALFSANQPVPLPECLSAILNGLIIGVALTVLLPLIEKIYNVVTNLTLLELSDQNHPVLRRLALEAPGTYQHTLMVAMLCEAAAKAIDANALLARVGCYYHDIGKINKPQYFVENENWGGSQHSKLKPSMSSLIITSHTRDGMALAEEYKLPKAIIDFIPEHHGTTLIEYFYRQAQENSENNEDIDDSLYRYPGPKPQSKETAVALIADSSEAACRTLENPTPSRIRNLVHEIILKKLLDNQFDECDLTLNDLRKIEDSFVRNLTSFYHQRVKYPGR